MHPSIKILFATRGNASKVVRASVEAYKRDRTQRPLNLKQVCQWKTLPRGVPANHVIVVAKALGVAKHKLRPDIYPPPKKESGNGTAS